MKKIYSSQPRGTSRNAEKMTFILHLRNGLSKNWMNVRKPPTSAEIYLGTPDVIGVKEARKTDILKFPTQLISAEIKTDANNLITAFGQACAYELFSHKSYLVIPKKSGEDDLARMDSLCLLHGIGLIHFDNENAEYPDFEIRNRATTHEPDLFYTNRYVKILADHKIIFD